MYEHEHDATLALNRHIRPRTQGPHSRLVLANLLHLPWSALALPIQRKGDATTDINASTSRSIIRKLPVGDTAGVDGDMGHASTAACLPGGIQQDAASRRARPLSGAVGAPNREPLL